MSSRQQTNPIEPQRLETLAEAIRTEIDAAQADFESAVGHAIQAGQKLIEAKSLVQHGQWLPWLRANFDQSEDTAGNYMRLARNSERVRNLPSIREAVVLLATPRSTGKLSEAMDAALSDVEHCHSDVLERLQAREIREAERGAVYDRLARAKAWLAVAEAYEEQEHALDALRALVDEIEATR